MRSLFPLARAVPRCARLSLIFIDPLPKVTPIVFVGLLPKNKAEQQALQKSTESSHLGGRVFLIVAGGSILFSIAQATYELIYDV